MSRKIMDSRAVSVPMDKPFDPVGLKYGIDGPLVDIHDCRCLALGMGLAFAAKVLSNGAAQKHREGKVGAKQCGSA